MEKHSFVDDLSMKHGYVKDYMRLHSSCLISHWFTLHHMALYNPRTSHRGFWLAKPTMGDFPDLEYQRVAVFRSFLFGSAAPVFTQWICHQSFSEVTSSEKNIFHRFFTLVMWQLTIEVTLHQLFTSTKSGDIFTIVSPFHFSEVLDPIPASFTSQPFSIFHLRYPLVNVYITNWKNHHAINGKIHYFDWAIHHFSWENPLFRLGHFQ